VGGDWFDAFRRSDGSIVVCVGDVTGRGLEAAGLMGKLRQSIGIASMYESEPNAILDTVDAHLRSRRAQAIATAFLGIIDPTHTTMRYATAGHPPALLRRGGRVVELVGEGLPLGLRDYANGSAHDVSLDGVDLLMLYTDGLVEGTRDLAFGERRLHDVASTQAVLYVRNPARLLCDACLPPEAQDDTAVLTVRFGKRMQWQFDAENAEAANEARKEFVEHLRKLRPGSTTLNAAELIFGELVGNVVRHAPGPIDVQLDLSQRNPVLHVIDRGVGFIRDPSLPADPLSESGRGLYIVAQLAKSVRVERIAGYGNHVAATLRR
jgi:anti-sigma regulatory factor (Ser/Thr protein kinase)